MKRLFVDLEVCDKCKDCKVCCDYFYHPQSNGITSLREFATFSLICRHCEEAPCVNSCYYEALEKQADGVLKRYSMRCTSCKSCAIACPFGTIFVDFIPYLTSRCDYCIGRKEDRLPECIPSCPEGAIQIKEVEEDAKKDIYFIGDNLAVHSRKWIREDMQIKK